MLRSITKKLVHLHAFLSEMKPDILVITETWLTPHILDSELTGGFPYFLYRKDRTQRKGGGVCCIVRSFLNCTEVKLNTNMAPDILCCDILMHGAASPLRIISVYRPPNTSPFRTPQTIRTAYSIHVRNLVAQKERLFLSLNRPLENNLYRKVCRDLDGHVKKLLANREHRLTRGSNLKRLFHYIRQKTRDNSGLPTLLDTSGKKYISDMQKARILGEYFASVFFQQWL
ncbi:hypothetical protein COOONC_08711 [Cooperia oncophora]